jgi:acetyltransferase-like isoleucine patch superfamily enzyme
VFGADAWIGERATIREGVTIGTGAVVGTGATVLRDVAPYTIVAGSPARHIRDRFDPEACDAHDRLVRAPWAQAAQ